MDIQLATRDYAQCISSNAITEPNGGTWVSAAAIYLGATEPVNGSWIAALCNQLGITQPLYGSYVIALADYYGISQPINGSWWFAIAQTACSAPPVVPFIWDQDTNNWEAESRVWNIGTPVAPTADFTSDSVTIVEGQSVQFTDTSTGIPTSWSWGFSGATPSTSNAQNPSVVYNTPGTYEVSLDVSNAQGSNVKTVPNYMTVTVVPIAADFSANNTTPTEGDTVTFTDTSTGNPTQWAWTTTGGTPATSSTQNPAIVYNTSGLYSVSLTASKTGATDTETKTNYIEVFVPGTVDPVTEFANGIFYNVVSNPLSRTEFSNGLLTNKLETL